MYPVVIHSFMFIFNVTLICGVWAPFLSLLLTRLNLLSTFNIYLINSYFRRWRQQWLSVGLLCPGLLVVVAHWGPTRDHIKSALPFLKTSKVYELARAWPNPRDKLLFSFGKGNEYFCLFINFIRK